MKSIFLSIISVLLLAACAPESDNTNTHTPKKVDPNTNSTIVEVQITNDTNLRYLKNDVLEVVTPIPEGTVIAYNIEDAPVFYDYRNSSGQVKRSTNGFYPKVTLVKVPKKFSNEFPQNEINDINNTPGGLYLSSIDIHSGSDSSGLIPALPTKASPDGRYLNHFTADGKPRRRKYSEYFKNRFGSQLNKHIKMSSLSQAEQKKWNAIYSELVTIGDRTRPTLRSNIFIGSGSSQKDVQLANQYSELFEKTGESQKFGAWSIAVLGTSRRHGFGNVPCAEFMSEVLRQAYTKAGYEMADDFKGRNYLIWSNTAAVVNLARALHESGWIPWDPNDYKPKTGAIGMHAKAAYPGHTYMIAGQNGRLVIDNGSPRGRDLFTTSSTHKRDLIGMMYDHGVFFLPPGVIPDKW